MGRAEEIPRLGWVIAFLGVTILLTFAYSSLKGTRPAPTAGHLKPLAPAPDFQLLDQTGKPFGLADLRGKIWAAAFLSTRDQGSGLLIGSRMEELNQMLGRAGGGVALVSFSLDSDFDRPDVLAAYAKKMGADPARWKFLTGSRGDVEAVAGLFRPPGSVPDGKPTPPTRIVLVDRDGRVRGFHDGSDPEAVQKLLMDIGDLLRESSPKNP